MPKVICYWTSGLYFEHEDWWRCGIKSSLFLVTFGHLMSLTLHAYFDFHFLGNFQHCTHTATLQHHGWLWMPVLRKGIWHPAGNERSPMARKVWPEAQDISWCNMWNYWPWLYDCLPQQARNPRGLSIGNAALIFLRNLQVHTRVFLYSDWPSLQITRNLAVN